MKIIQFEVMKNWPTIFLFHPSQHAPTHVGSVWGQRTTNASTANPAGCFTTTSVWVSAVFQRPCAGFPNDGPELFLIIVYPVGGFFVDIDECGTELARCPSNTYCHNTDGSYECRGMLVCVSDDFFERCPLVIYFFCVCSGCDQACVGCMGSGPARCKKCARGYRLKGAKCLGEDGC